MRDDVMQGAVRPGSQAEPKFAPMQISPDRDASRVNAQLSGMVGPIEPVYQRPWQTPGLRLFGFAPPDEKVVWRSSKMGLPALGSLGQTKVVTIKLLAMALLAGPPFGEIPARPLLFSATS